VQFAVAARPHKYGAASASHYALHVGLRARAPPYKTRTKNSWLSTSPMSMCLYPLSLPFSLSNQQSNYTTTLRERNIGNPLPFWPIWMWGRLFTFPRRQRYNDALSINNTYYIYIYIYSQSTHTHKPNPPKNFSSPHSQLLNDETF
jgi:hypothetical protein